MHEDAIRKTVASNYKVSLDDSFACISTPCLYPSNDSVILRISRDKDKFVVSDNAGAAHEAMTRGIPAHKEKHAITRIAERQGLVFSNGEIASPPIDAANIPAAIALVANASRKTAHRFLTRSNTRTKSSKNESKRSSPSHAGT